MRLQVCVCEDKIFVYMDFRRPRAHSAARLPPQTKARSQLARLGHNRTAPPSHRRARVRVRRRARIRAVGLSSSRPQRFSSFAGRDVGIARRSDVAAGGDRRRGRMDCRIDRAGRTAGGLASGDVTPGDRGRACDVARHVRRPCVGRVRAAARRATSHQAGSRRLGVRRVTVRQTGSRRATMRHATAGDRASGDHARSDRAPGGRAPGGLAPGDHAPRDRGPSDRGPGGRAPGDLTSGGLAPTGCAPGGLAPRDRG